MSKNITIQEGGTAKQLTADKLKTNVVGGGTCLWVPEDEVQLTTKYISENGTYHAEDDDHYGYSQVTVNVAGGNGSADSSGLPSGTVPSGGIGSSIMGFDPESGNEFAFGVDSQGNIVRTLLPSYISVYTPPSKTDYVDGEAINISGIVVKAYAQNGNLWTDRAHPDGILNTMELTINPSVADLDAAVKTYEVADPQSIGVNSPCFLSTPSVGDGYNNYVIPSAYITEIEGAPLVHMEGNPGNVSTVFLSTSPFKITTKQEGSETVHSVVTGSARQYQGMTVYVYSGIASSNQGRPYPISAKNTDNVTAAIKAMLSIIGGGGFKAIQNIDVEWTYNMIGRTLNTMFDIYVSNSDD